MVQPWKPTTEFASIVYDVGFKYDPEQDIIYSRMYPWQRDFGYAHFYDFVAPKTISAVIDCEPFFFRHDNRDWMIELWKGQYGLETGGEIGVYICQQPYLNPILGWRPQDPENAKFFDCISDGKRLTMSFTLHRDGVHLFGRGPEKHWWLTGFKWGVLSRPEQLTMALQISFPNEAMQKSFLEAAQRIGYTDIAVESTTVRFTFDKPKTDQLHTDPEYRRHMSVDDVEQYNASIVRTYADLGLKNNDPNELSGEASRELIEYFKRYTYTPDFFAKHMVDPHVFHGQDRGPIVDALEKLGRRNRSLRRRIGIAWRRFVSRLRTIG